MIFLDMIHRRDGHRNLGFIVSMTAFLLVCQGSDTKLNDYIIYYEVLDYNTNDIQKRIRLNEESPVIIRFHSYGKDFALILKKADADFMYEGTVSGCTHCSVYGSLRDGVFEGQINSQWGIYHIERAERYFPPGVSSTRTYHSVIYSEQDVANPYLHWGNRNDSMTNFHDDPEPASTVTRTHFASRNPHNIRQDSRQKKRTSKFSHRYKKINENLPSQKHSETGVPKRVTRELPDDTIVCQLYIRTDPFLWDAVIKKPFMNEQSAHDNIILLVGQHVDAVNLYYSKLKFVGNSMQKRLQFEVKKIEVETEKYCQEGRLKSRLCSKNLTAMELWRLHSEQNYDDYCLSYAITYRHFGTVLGKAYFPEVHVTGNGACGKYKPDYNQSFNTGFITLRNYEKDEWLPIDISKQTLAHEIAHSLGSKHDSKHHCDEEHDLMCETDNPDIKLDDIALSEDSKRNITRILDLVFSGAKRNCFMDPTAAFCGNKIIEEGEECDCGLDEEECGSESQCCYPRIIHNVVNASGCKRKTDPSCSPSSAGINSLRVFILIPSVLCPLFGLYGIL